MANNAKTTTEKTSTATSQAGLYGYQPIAVDFKLEGKKEVQTYLKKYSDLSERILERSKIVISKSSTEKEKSAFIDLKNIVALKRVIKAEVMKSKKGSSKNSNKVHTFICSHHLKIQRGTEIEKRIVTMTSKDLNDFMKTYRATKIDKLPKLTVAS